MGRPYRMIVKETSPDSTSESIPEKLAFASFTLIVVGMIESSTKFLRSIAYEGLLCQLRLVGQLYRGRTTASESAFTKSATKNEPLSNCVIQKDEPL